MRRYIRLKSHYRHHTIHTFALGVPVVYLSLVRINHFFTFLFRFLFYFRSNLLSLCKSFCISVSVPRYQNLLCEMDFTCCCEFVVQCSLKHATLCRISIISLRRKNKHFVGQMAFNKPHFIT